MKGLCLCLLLAACSAGDRPDDVGTAPAPADGYVTLAGVRFHYRDYGGAGDLMVLVPGLYMTAHVYDQLAPHFTDRYRVLAMTPRWHGTSDTTGDFSLDTLANDIAGFIDHFTHAPAVVVGWATAGLELPILARQRPDLVKALVLLNAVWANIPFPPGLPRWPPGGTEPDSVYPSLDAAAAQLGPGMNIRSASALRGALAGSLYRRDDGMYTWLPPSGTSAEPRILSLYDSAPSYHGLGVPILALQVDQRTAAAADLAALGFPQDTIDLAVRWSREYDNPSRALGLEQLQAADRDVEVARLDDVNHNFVIDRPEVVARIVNTYLDRFAP